MRNEKFIKYNAQLSLLGMWRHVRDQRAKETCCGCLCIFQHHAVSTKGGGDVENIGCNCNTADFQSRGRRFEPWLRLSWSFLSDSWQL